MQCSGASIAPAQVLALRAQTGKRAGKMRACTATFTQRGLQVTRFEVAHTAALALGERRVSSSCIARAAAATMPMTCQWRINVLLQRWQRRRAGAAQLQALTHPMCPQHISHVSVLPNKCPVQRRVSPGYSAVTQKKARKHQCESQRRMRALARATHVSVFALTSASCSSKRREISRRPSSAAACRAV